MSPAVTLQLEKLRELGFKITPQRIAVLELLDGNTSHPTIEDLYRHLKQNLLPISRATVYNTVKILTRNQMLLELPILKEASNFDPDTSNHDHAYCTSCGSIMDIFHEKKFHRESMSQDDKLPGFRVHSVSKIYYGMCPDCSASESKVRSSRPSL